VFQNAKSPIFKSLIHRSKKTAAPLPQLAEKVHGNAEVDKHTHNIVQCCDEGPGSHGRVNFNPVKQQRDECSKQ